MLKVRVVDRIPMSPREAKIVAEGYDLVREQFARLVEQGILDANGRLQSDVIPKDMQEDSKTEV